MASNRPDPRPWSPSNFNAQLGTRIRDVRNALGFQQHELAARAGLRRDQLSKFEHGVQPPTVQALCRLAVAFGLPVDALLPELPVGDELNRELYRGYRRIWFLNRRVRTIYAAFLGALFDYFANPGDGREAGAAEGKGDASRR
ncbi:MAG TPA: helix-turn-helix transcriptional regulator [Thermoanaerobaculia bacterium]|jgi:transcriptional regulator with XRE-family HTH domain